MIFGPIRARRGAELKVMSAIEHKRPGTFVRDGEMRMQKRLPGDHNPEGWSEDVFVLAGDEFSCVPRPVAQGGSCLASAPRSLECEKAVLPPLSGDDGDECCLLSPVMMVMSVASSLRWKTRRSGTALRTMHLARLVC